MSRLPPSRLPQSRSIYENQKEEILEKSEDCSIRPLESDGLIALQEKRR
jgi:hypothetical protein